MSVLFSVYIALSELRCEVKEQEVKPLRPCSTERRFSWMKFVRLHQGWFTIHDNLDRFTFINSPHIKRVDSTSPLRSESGGNIFWKKTLWNTKQRRTVRLRLLSQIKNWHLSRIVVFIKKRNLIRYFSIFIAQLLSCQNLLCEPTNSARIRSNVETLMLMLIPNSLSFWFGYPFLQSSLNVDRRA